MADDTTQQQDDSLAAQDSAALEDAAHWAEFDAAETGKAPDAGADGDDAAWQPEGADDAASGGDGNVHDGGSAKNEGDSAADADAGADQASATDNDGTSSGDTPDAAAAQTQADTLWANATPEQRAAFDAARKQAEDYEGRDKRLRGQISALQRQVNELSTQRKPAASSQAADDDKADGFIASDEWKSFSEEYPEVAGPLGGVIERLQKTIDTQGKELAAIGTDRRQDALDEQLALLTERHSDWEHVVTEDPESFRGWLDSQPRHIREAFERNRESVVDAEEAADVVGRYKAFRQATTQQQDGNGEGQGSADKRPNGSDAGKGNGNDTASPPLSDKRKRQLDSSVTTRTNGPSGASGIPESGDESVLWDQLEKAGL